MSAHKHLQGIVMSPRCTECRECHQKLCHVLYADSKKSDILMPKTVTGLFEIWLPGAPQTPAGNISTANSSLEQILKRENLNTV